MKNISWLMVVCNIGPLFGFFCIVLGIVGLIFLRDTIMEVDFYGGHSYGYLQSGKSYSLVGSSYTQVQARVQGTIYLNFTEFGSQEVFKKNISLSFGYIEEDTDTFQETHIPITNIQVNESGNYLLSYEPSMTGTSGKIVLEDSLYIHFWE